MRNFLYQSTALSAVALAGIAFIGTAQPAAALPGASSCPLFIQNVTLTQDVRFGNNPMDPSRFDFTTTGKITIYEHASPNAQPVDVGDYPWVNWSYNPKNETGVPDLIAYKYYEPVAPFAYPIEVETAQAYAASLYSGCANLPIGNPFPYCSGSDNNGCGGGGPVGGGGGGGTGPGGGGAGPR